MFSNSSARTLISTVTPIGYPTEYSLNVCPLPPHLAILLAAILGSFVIDWILRRKSPQTLRVKFIIEQLPIVDFEVKTKRAESITKAILARGCRLVCTSSPFSQIWNTCFNENWSSPRFLVFKTITMINMGPKDEREIRNRLYRSARESGLVSGERNLVCMIRSQTWVTLAIELRFVLR